MISLTIINIILVIFIMVLFKDYHAINSKGYGVFDKHRFIIVMSSVLFACFLFMNILQYNTFKSAISILADNNITKATNTHINRVLEEEYKERFINTYSKKVEHYE